MRSKYGVGIFEMTELRVGLPKDDFIERFINGSELMGSFCFSIDVGILGSRECCNIS